MGVDPGTAAAIAAVPLAGVALVIALGQTSQQYVSSGQLIRLCDSVVFGGRATGLPGRGRRIWSWSQLRFRVIYDMPVFGLATNQADFPWDVPPVSSNDAGIDADANERLLEPLISYIQVGEASWVSFCRLAKGPCEDRLVLTSVTADADRCPADLPNVPMPLSLRDVVIIAFAMGLTCTDASYRGRTISMQGRAGSLTTSQHPVLGPLVHFIPGFDPVVLPRPASWRQWVGRLFGVIPVGQELITRAGRGGRIRREKSDVFLCLIRELGSNVSPENIHEGLERWERERSLHQYRTLNSVNWTSYAAESKQHLTDRVATQGETIGWYWISQMNVFQGTWATPWSIPQSANQCFAAFAWTHDVLRKDAALEANVKMVTDDELRAAFRHDIPQMSEPSLRFGNPTGIPMTARSARGAQSRGWMYYPRFDATLPRIMTLDLSRFGPGRDRHALFVSTALVSSDLQMMEIAALDQWLSCAASTNVIRTGKGQVESRTPAMVEYVLDALFDRMASVLDPDIGPPRSSDEIIQFLRRLGLIEPEMLFVIVAMLRTLRVAYCIAIGQSSRAALEILERDLIVHMV